MVGLMHVELQTTCSALGYQEGSVYHKEPDCLETVKDLIRFLKREDEACEIRRQLGDAQIVQNDLVPLLKQYGDDRVLWETIVRLLVNLTQPAVLCFENHVPEDKIQRNYFLEIESHLQAYKDVFADEALFAIITKKLGDLLQLDWEHRQEEDRLLIERILILVRNVLHVPPNVIRDQRTDDDASVHDQVLWALHVSGLEDLLLYLASSEEERQFAFHVLEIIALMFREQTPEQLASAGVGRTLTERERDERELELMREEERAKKRTAVRKFSSRHSRFGGTFVVSNVKSISEHEVIMHRPVKDVHDMAFDKNKVPKKKPKNRRPLTESEYTRRSTLSIRIFLKEFCMQFLESCYNPLMSAVKDTLMRAGAQENDETYYLWTMRFFMEFQRRHSFRVDLVGETMSVQAFHYVQTNMTNYHEMLLTNKKEAIIWSRRMHLALRAYYELLQSLCMMDRSKEHGVRESAKIIKSNVFYMMEYRDVFLTLLKKFDETRQSRGFLRDLVDATHLFLKMLEMHSTKTGHMVVQKKKRKKGKKKLKPVSANQEMTLTPQELDDLWDEVSGDLSAIFQGRLEVPTDVMPFDAASQIDVDQQRAEAMIRIQEAMRAHQAGEAVALFRAAREVWPENEQFGKADINPEEEFMALREVFLAELPRSQAASQEPEPQEEVEDEDEDEERTAAYETVDEQFNFKEFVGRFANPQVVRAYTTLLSIYHKNSASTNHAIIKMFHRIAFDAGVIGLLFQASLFRVFLRILNDPASNTTHFKEMVTFVRHVVRKFFDLAENNKKLFVELFFLKNMKEALDVVDGYGCIRESVKGKTAWTEEQEQEVRDLFERFQHEDVPGQDVADLILGQLTDSRKTRRQLINAMVHLGLIGSAKELKRKAPTMRQRGWQEEDEAELKTLFDQHREASDPVAEILAVMSNPRSKALIKKKLVELGLVSDLKELRKKRASKSGGGRSKKGKGGTDSWDDNEEIDDDLPNFTSSESEDQDDAQHTRVGIGSASSGDDSDGDEPMYVKNIKRAARKLFDKDKAAAVQWLQTALTSVAEDREEDDDDQPISLVPITEVHEDAMEDEEFKNLLKKVGIKPPDNEQERFWRVPGSLAPADLQTRAAALRVPVPGEKSARPEKKADGRREKLKALVKQKKEVAREKEDNKTEGKGKRRSRFRADMAKTSLPEDGTSEGSEQTASRKRTGTTRQRGWQEEEEAELKSLFAQHRMASDPVTEILAEMSNPRSKALIKKKLLELGLVSDLKELRKKRVSKSSGGRSKKGKGKDTWDSNDEIDDNLPNFTSSESENEVDVSRAHHVDNGGTASGGDPDGDEPMYVKNIKRAAEKVFRKDKAAAIQWLQTSLTSIAEDREEDDDDQPISLVPITEVHADAMEDEEFKSLLKKVGIKPPKNEQESFWRVPGSLTPTDLRTRVAALHAPLPGEEPHSGQRKKKTDERPENLKAHAKQKAAREKANSKIDGRAKKRSRVRAEVEETLLPEDGPSEGSEQTPSSQQNGSSQKIGSSQQMKSSQSTGSSQRSGSSLSRSNSPSQSHSMQSQSSRSQSSRSQSSPSQTGSSQMSPVKKARATKRIRKAMDSDSSDDSDNERLVIADVTSHESLPRTKRPRVVLADSSEDEDIHQVAAPLANSRLTVASDTDDEPLVKKTESFPATAFTMEQDSDSDVDDHVPLRRGVKRAALIESDEDE